MLIFAPQLIGGILIGFAASLLLLLNGRVFGVSGVLGGLIAGQNQQWRWYTLLGLILGGAVFVVTGSPVFDDESVNITLGQAGLAGLLVGFGTRLGSGCTSGHGVCGISRLSRRSIVATLIFIAAGMATATFFS